MFFSQAAFVKHLQIANLIDLRDVSRAQTKETGLRRTNELFAICGDDDSEKECGRCSRPAFSLAIAEFARKSDVQRD